MAEALNGTGFGEAVLAVFRATNMLSPFEKTWLQNVLRGLGSDEFVQAAAGFANDGTGLALGQLKRVLEPHDCAKWTIATYLPFLWRPDSHMFFKPEATKDFADRVVHPFSSLYQAQLEFDVYESLLDLAERTSRELLDLAPGNRSLDRIDIQSFVWVVGDYREDREGVYP